MEVIVTIGERQTKELLKAAFIELIEEQPNIFGDILLETLEDVGLARAIQEGRRDDFVSEESVFDL